MRFLRSVLAEFSNDQCNTHAAAISYYTVFALPPLLYLLSFVVSAGLSVAYDSQVAEEKAADALEQQATQLLGDRSAAKEVGDMIQRSHQSPGTWWKTAVSIVGVLVGVGGFMGALQTALNNVWDVKPDPERSFLRYLLKKRAISFALVLGLGLLLLVSIVLSGVIAYLGSQVESVFGVEPLSAASINYGVQALAAFVVFAVTFKAIPDIRIAWRDVVLGALITTALFLMGRSALQRYFTVMQPGAQLGEAAASVAAIFVWVYYSSMIVLLGAEATKVYADRVGRDIRPKSRAVRVVEQIDRG